MNKKMRELLAAIQQKNEDAKKHFEAGETEKAGAALDEAETLRKEYDVAKRLYEAEKADVPDDPEPTQKKAVDGFGFIAKMVRGERLDDAEKALLVDGTSGENNLIPEDVDTTIRELRRQYKAARELVTVIPTSSMSGSFVFEDAEGGGTGLVDFTDGDEIDATEQPKFVKKAFAIHLCGKLIPISNILKGAERSGLMAYLNTWFVRNAVKAENRKIFVALKTGKTAKTLKGWEAFKSSINKDLDPDVKIGAVIVTNQTGFDVLDSEKDETGRPILKENPAEPTEKIFQGLPIHVFSDAALPNVSGKAPVFYGNLKMGCYMEEMIGYEFAVSEHVFFGKNQTALRVIEGFDVTQADAEAYIYGTLEPSAAAAPTAK